MKKIKEGPEDNMADTISLSLPKANVTKPPTLLNPELSNER